MRPVVVLDARPARPRLKPKVGQLLLVLVAPDVVFVERQVTGLGARLFVARREQRQPGHQPVLLLALA